MALSIVEYPVFVQDIITESPETKTFRLDMTGKKFSFKPGQFVMLTVTIPGKGPVTRPYSIASSPLDSDVLDLTIKKFDGGVLSKFLCEEAQLGDMYKIKGPYGLFTLNESAPHLVFIAAGSGIAPFRSMWRYVAQKQLHIPITLLFSSKTKEYIIFKQELDQIASNGVRVEHTLTRNQDSAWEGRTGRIDKEMIEAVAGEFTDTFFYTCGPPAMCHGAADALKELGVPLAHIKMEKYD